MDIGRNRQVLFVAALATAGLGGCVERELTITSEPPGALVFVSSEPIGRTPVTKRFEWYGDYDIVLRREGYQTLKTHARINPRWYEIPPVDLLSQIAPWTYRDPRFLHYKLEKLKPTSDKKLIDRAAKMEKRARAPED